MKNIYKIYSIASIGVIKIIEFDIVKETNAFIHSHSVRYKKSSLDMFTEARTKDDIFIITEDKNRIMEHYFSIKKVINKLYSERIELNTKLRSSLTLLEEPEGMNDLNLEFIINASHIYKNWEMKTPKITELIIKGQTKDDLFINVFKKINRYKYCNDDNIKLKNSQLTTEYNDWISNIGNYVRAGGDMM